jgi:hypothetical protein
MSVRTRKSKTSSRSRVLGAKTFAAIAAVEGLKLSAAGKKRLSTLKASGLSTAQRRKAILRSYKGAKGHK